jgi:hypothetical protein
MFDNTNGEPERLSEVEVVRQQRNNLMLRVLEMEIQLAMQEDELRRLRAPKVAEVPE